ncbi:MAG: AraC family transcriptional regulator [Lachnospiraceae bacterium]|nr:AraC family transcriptional regulator [Lachnospiraceae bacterium]
MNKELYEKLLPVTPEEKEILRGNGQIDRKIYMSGKESIIDAARLLEDGKLITIRPHTRFAHFPAHAHNYIEVIYMCSGSTRHIVDGNEIILKEGELLFLSRKAVQEIYPAGRNDIAVNFIILPEFFAQSLKMIGNESSPLHSFIVDGLINKNNGPSYLHFKVADVLPVQNLVENLIWSIENRQSNRRSINQSTMGVLFLLLLDHIDRVEVYDSGRDQKLMLSVLSYIEENYVNGELKELAALLHYDVFWLSREIKKISHRTFSEMIRQKRLNQACYLLKNTRMRIVDISLAVGYENVSYFHRVFHSRYGMSPRQYRLS